MHSKILFEPALVGREKELAQLELYLKEAAEGNGATIFVSGEAGAGKTRLIGAFLEKAKNKGVSVLSGWCLSEATAPFFPFIEAFKSFYTRQSEKDKSSNLKQTEDQFNLRENPKAIDEESGTTTMANGSRLLETLLTPDSFSPQVWKDQAFTVVADKLHSISSKMPLILFIDDIHWADSASLALIHYISRAINKSEKVLLLGTFRSEELTADAEGHPHPLVEVMRIMRREELFTEIKLSNLNKTEVARVAEAMVGGSLQPQLAEILAVESKGNPLFIVESLRMLHERQSLTMENNQWRLAVTELGLPNKIKDIILRRLAGLKYSQRRVLDAAAVIGEKFDVELLGSVLGLDILEVLETLNMVANSTGLVSVEGNCYKFDHDRSRVTLYEELALPLKQGYHTKIGAILETRTGAAPPLSDLTYHYAQAGNKEKALKYALAAAKDAAARFSNQQAIQHFKYVLQNTKECSAEQIEIALEGLGDAYAANSMFANAIETFNELASSNTGLVRMRALRKAMDAAFHKGDRPDLLLEYAKEAEKLAAFDRLEMGRVLNNRGRAFAYAGRGDMRLDLADYNAALQIFEEENSLPDMADALWRSGILTSGVGSVEEGLNRLLRSIAIFREIGDVRKEAEATLATGQMFFGMGIFLEAKKKLIAVLRIGEKLGMFVQLAIASDALGLIYEHEGNLMEALSQILKANEYAKKTDARQWDAARSASLVRLYCKLGELNQADNLFRIMMKTAYPALIRLRKIGAAAFNSINPTKAVYFGAKGQFEISNKIFENHFRLLKMTATIIGWEMRMREDYVWILEKQGKAEEAKAQREKIEALLKHTKEKSGHANIQLNVTATRKVQVGEEFEVRLDIVNVGGSSASLVKIEGVAPPEFKTVCAASCCSQKNNALEIKSKKIDPFEVETIKVKMEATKPGIYSLNPEITYINDLDKIRTFEAEALTITVEEPQPTYEKLPGRMTTGDTELDELLFGGIPESYTIVLSSSPVDERITFVEKFLEAGIKSGQTTFYITADPGKTKKIAEECPSNFILVICNPQANAIIQDIPNVFKLKGVENLTEIDIALARAIRTLKTQTAGPKRICIEILSDVLLQHHAVITRKWLGGLLPILKSKGFTTLAVINPDMHPREELQAILGLFEGEIQISEKETGRGVEKVLRIRRLSNQKYLGNELILTGKTSE